MPFESKQNEFSDLALIQTKEVKEPINPDSTRSFNLTWLPNTKQEQRELII